MYGLFTVNKLQWINSVFLNIHSEAGGKVIVTDNGYMLNPHSVLNPLRVGFSLCFVTWSSTCSGSWGNLGASGAQWGCTGFWVPLKGTLQPEAAGGQQVNESGRLVTVQGSWNVRKKSHVEDRLSAEIWTFFLNTKVSKFSTFFKFKNMKKVFWCLGVQTTESSWRGQKDLITPSPSWHVLVERLFPGPVSGLSLLLPSCLAHPGCTGISLLCYGI